MLFTGRVSDEHKARIISESKFTVLPRVQEGFGIVLLESWALGKPVMVADVPPLNELVDGKNGLTISPYSVNKWVSSLSEALTRKRWVTKASVERYDIKKAVSRVEQVALPFFWISIEVRGRHSKRLSCSLRAFANRGRPDSICGLF